MVHRGSYRVSTNHTHPPAAAEEVRKAQALQTSLTDRERRRIEVTAKHLEARQDLKNHEKHEAYKKTLDAALDSNPDDVEQWLLRGNAEEPAADGRGQRGKSGSIAFYEAATASSPDNFAANHSSSHSLENICRNQDA